MNKTHIKHKKHEMNQTRIKNKKKPKLKRKRITNKQKRKMNQQLNKKT